MHSIWDPNSNTQDAKARSISKLCTELYLLTLRRACLVYPTKHATGGSTEISSEFKLEIRGYVMCSLLFNSVFFFKNYHLFSSHSKKQYKLLRFV